MVEVQHNSTLKIIINNGPDFIMSNFYSSKSILHQTNWVKSSQQSTKVERIHQHILNITKAFIFQANTPKTLWSYDVNHVVFIMNRVPSPILENKLPHYLLFNEDLVSIL